MEQEQVNDIKARNEADQNRSFGLSLLCMIVFVYSVFFILLFIAGIIFSKWITNLLNDFAIARQYSESSVILFNSTAIFLYGLSFSGALLMWRLNRLGYYMYIFATVLLAVIPFFIGFGNILNVIIFILLIIFFSIYILKLA